MSNWLYKNKEINSVEEFPESAIGFIYKITNSKTGKFYIGKKILNNATSKPLTKKEKLEWSKPGRIPKKKRGTKESNWKAYYGSSKTLLEAIQIEGIQNFKREIIDFCSSKKSMSYKELKWQFFYNVLEVESYNENILGRYFRKDIV